MIYKLTGYTADGDEAPAEEMLISADFIQDGTTIILCPMEGEITIAAAEGVRNQLAHAGIKAVVFARPVQVWKIVPADVPKVAADG